MQKLRVLFDDPSPQFLANSSNPVGMSLRWPFPFYIIISQHPSLMHSGSLYILVRSTLFSPCCTHFLQWLFANPLGIPSIRQRLRHHATHTSGTARGYNDGGHFWYSGTRNWFATTPTHYTISCRLQQLQKPSLLSLFHPLHGMLRDPAEHVRK